MRKYLFFAMMVVSCRARSVYEDEVLVGKPQNHVFLEELEKMPLNLTLTPVVLSRYLIQNGAIIHKHPVIQTDAYFLLPKGLYFDAWWSVGTEDSDLSSDFGDEVDWTVGWAHDFEFAGTNVGVSYYDIIELFEGLRGDILFPFGEINKKFQWYEDYFSLTPYASFYGVYPAHGDEPENGMRAFGGLREIFDTPFIFKLEGESYLLWEDGALGFDPGLVGRQSAWIVWKISKPFSLHVPMVRVSSPLTEVDDGREFEVVYGGGVSVSF